MTRRSRQMLYDVHCLASRYHWSESEVLRLTLPRRASYLEIIEQEDRRPLIEALEER